MSTMNEADFAVFEGEIDGKAVYTVVVKGSAAHNAATLMTWLSPARAGIAKRALADLARRVAEDDLGALAILGLAKSLPSEGSRGGASDAGRGSRSRAGQK